MKKQSITVVIVIVIFIGVFLALFTKLSSDGMIYPLHTLIGLVSAVVTAIAVLLWQQTLALDALILSFMLAMSIVTFAVTYLLMQTACTKQVQEFTGRWLAYAELFYNKPLLLNGWCRMVNMPSDGIYISGIFRTADKCERQKDFAHTAGITSDGKVLNEYCPECGCVPKQVFVIARVKNNKIVEIVESPDAPECFVSLNQSYAETVLRCRNNPSECKIPKLIYGALSLPHAVLVLTVKSVERLMLEVVR